MLVKSELILCLNLSDFLGGYLGFAGLLDSTANADFIKGKLRRILC